MEGFDRKMFRDRPTTTNTLYTYTNLPNKVNLKSVGHGRLYGRYLHEAGEVSLEMLWLHDRPSATGQFVELSTYPM